MPQTCNMFGFLHAHGEEAAATACNNNNGPFAPATDISPVGDAAEGPTQFTPDTGSAVVFEDIGEGAGFEDSFGWYNVGDDVSTGSGRQQNLHVVLGVNDDMVNIPFSFADNTIHYGNPADYKKNAEESTGTGSAGDPGFIKVDFAAEKTAGRYKGGFISFYMISPEGSPAGDNNGDYTIGSAGDGGGAGKSKLGKIYFTDKDLNNDGDFVHYLVYGSKAKAKTFLFGFEDLFRGGDNDFEDMLIRVSGLTPPCIPTAEICDGLDNDCDGKIDEAGPSLGTGSACLCDSAADCDDGPLKGACENGTTVCKNGALTCHSTTTPTQEICDNLDNNCDGIVDNNPTGGTLGQACDGPDADLCKEGVFVCSNGVIVCNDNTGNNVEVCNGSDDNCNGQTDEGNPGGGSACGVAKGICTPGVLTCSGGSLKCIGGTGSAAETCNGLDDNCDGIVDNNPTDVGSACGSNAVGACKKGTTVCLSGEIQCAGQVGPTPETCNKIDDDCDGKTDESPVDVGQPCGQSTGACSPGQTVCVNGAIVCQGGVGPGSEICDGIDNDCDGIVDEDVPGVGSACGTSGSGACAAGIDKCINGSLQCVGGSGSGTEVCNGIDDDCDGKIDEGDLCSGGVCDHGVCAAPCVQSEFPCPPGKKCDANMFCVDDPCSGITCPNDMDGNAQSCQGAACAPICNDPANQCAAPFVCRGTDGSCVPNTCDYIPSLCTAGQLCVNSACTTDPCAGVTCASGQFCSGGTCQASCTGVSCDDNQTCVNGACVATGCPTACTGTTVCDPTMGKCVTNMCADQSCPTHQTCNPLTGGCISDPCNGVACPIAGEACSDGIDGSGNVIPQCGSGAHGQFVTAAGAGCDATGGDKSGFVLIGAVLFGLLLRKRRALWLPLVASLSLAGSGCKLNDYCIDCEAGDDGGVPHDGGTGSDGTVNPGDGGSNVTCDPNNVHQETCNGADDDCDGKIDEGFNLNTDPLNCGKCGVQCNKPGAQTTCNNGQCQITGCFPGFVDVDMDTSTYATSDGCEYACFQSNGGVEACDNLDNDCDGKVDEGIDVSSDVNNCGMCGRQCEFFEAKATCGSGACTFNPATDCGSGFIDVDHMQMDGCEYQCAKTNGGVEKCDLIDNDCDGIVDNGFNTGSDVNNCGQCGNKCAFPNATPKCTIGKCTFNPVTDCAPGFVDANGNPLDGCEYACVKSNGGIEKCDGKDNDCDGKVDEAPSDAGGTCAAVNPVKGACQANGTFVCSNGALVCNGATQPTVETCNNIDDDCDGTVDDGVVRTCYDGPAATNGVGACKPGTQTCAAGAFPAACSGEVKPTTELCNGIDDDCDGTVDNGPGSAAITQTCYAGSAGTAGVGTCKSGTQTCSFGSFGGCIGEVDPKPDVCGDGLDTDCDGKNDAAEGCLTDNAEFRLDGTDATAGTLGTAAGAQHSHDLVMAVGGNPLGTNVYVAWDEAVGGKTAVYLRASTNGGANWGAIVNVTTGIGSNNLEPVIAVQPNATVGGADTLAIAYVNVGTSLVRDIFVQHSTNNGATWSASTGAIDGAADSFHQQIAISGATVVVTWEALDTGTLNRDVISKTSTNTGATFGTAMTLNSSSTLATRFAGRPQVGLTSSGGVVGAVWAWREQRSGATRDIFARFTTNATTAPTGNDIRVDSDSTDTRDSDFPVLVTAGTAAYLTWQDPSTVANGGSNIGFSHSVNGGSSWSTQQTIDDPGAELSASFTPTMAIDPKTSAQTDDVIAIAWQDQRLGTQVFASISSDGAATFATPTRASNEGGLPVSGIVTVPWIVAAGSGVFVVSWEDQTATGAPEHIFSSSSIDNGVSWSFDQAQLDTGAGTAVGPRVEPTLVGGKTSAVTAWNDFRTNHINGDIFEVVSHQ